MMVVALVATLEFNTNKETAVVDKHQPYQHLEGHDEGINIDKEVDEVA